MKTLSCKAMNPATECDMVVKGETETEVMDQMMAHAREHHADDIAGMSEEDAMSKMRAGMMEE